MKTSVLLFVVGIALGVAATLVLGPSRNAGDRQVENASSITPGGRAPDHGSIPTRSERKSGKTRTRTSGNGDPAAELDELLSSLMAIEDESELNLMLLIRQASMLTHLNESEAVSMLHQLAQPVEDDNYGRQEFNEIASAIIFSRLCELNGPEAMRMASAGELMEDLDENIVALGMNSWVEADPEGAQRWFDGILGEADALVLKGEDEAELPATIAIIENDALREAFFNGMAKHDPEALEQSLGKFESDEVRDTVREEMMNGLVNQESSAQGLLEILNRSTDLDDVRESAIEKLSEVDPEQAATWVEGQPASSSRDHEINQVADELMEQNSDAGIEWFMNQQMSEPEREKDRLSRIANHLAYDDPSKASQWIAQQPDNAVRDGAEAALAWTYANQNDWTTSMTWLAGVQDQKSRDQTLNRVLRNGWDRENKQLKPEVITAAEAAGFGDTARDYQPK